MPEDENENSEPQEPSPQIMRRRFFTRRNGVIAAVVLAAAAFLLVLFSFIIYRSGVFNNYVKTQFVTKMADIGVDFSADVFRVTVNPLELELKNATFNDRVSGEKLFFIRDAHLLLTVQNLYAWQLSRDISIDKTEIKGAEAWVKFDENGRSNFANLKLVEDERGSSVNFKYNSVDFSLADSVVHFGDLSRKVSGNAKNVLFLLSPENREVPDEQKRYKFDLTSTDSNFIYNESSVEDIDIRASGIADNRGAEIKSFELKTPIGESTLTGTLTDWAAPRYEFDIQSSVDLTQASSILPIGTSLVGVGNFKGKVTGEGETYRIEGEADAQSLRANGVYLKAVNVEATVAGTNANYEANGTAVAEMLTFEDFRVDFLKLSGNVRGTGTDFRWLGELQAAAAKTNDLGIGGLFLRDATAEVRDRELTAQAGSGRAQKFSIKDLEFAELQARNLKFSLANGTVNVSAPNGNTKSLSSKDFSLQGVTGQNVRVKHRKGTTEVGLNNVRADAGSIKGIKAKKLSVDDFQLTDLPKTTDFTAKNLRVDQLNIDGTTVSGVTAPTVDLENISGGALTVYADKTRVAKIDTGSAVLGSINIGGVRLTVRQGRVEATSNDIDAGDVTLAKTKNLPQGGKLEAVKIQKPVYILEPSGRYRVTADMSLGGGAIGSVALGAARSKVNVTNERVALNDLTATVMNGQLNGRAEIALNNRTASTVTGDFANLDISKLLALQSGRIIPIEGETTGNIDLTFSGTNFRTASGTVNAGITANAGTADSGLIPISGQVRLNAANGLFNIDTADLRSANSSLNASGRFDLKDQNSDLTLALRSADASEIERLVRVLGVSPEFERQMDSMQVAVGGKLTFDGSLTGNLSDPTIDGKASLDSIALRGREIGSVSTDIFVSPSGTELRNGKLRESSGGNASFTVSIPTGKTNSVAVKAELTNINAGNLLAALPIDLPEGIRDLNGNTSGTVDITGLPEQATGLIDLAAANGVIAGQAFDNLKVKAGFSGTRIELQTGEMQIGAGRLNASGNFDRASSAFAADLNGKGVPLPLVLALLPKSVSLPVISGDLDFTAKATGEYNRPSTYDVNFNGIAPNVAVNETSLGNIAFNGKTVNRVLTAELTANLDGRPQVINASVNLADDNLPFMASTDFNQSPVAPFLAFVKQLKDFPITGTGTGRVEFGGNLSALDDKGKRIYTAANLSGTAQFSQLALQIQETPLAAAEPIVIRFNPREIIFESARFAGGGSNMTIAGTKALTDNGNNNLSIDGRVNLTLLNLLTKDTFFSGFADTSVRLSGPNATARLSGTANIVNGSVATFMGSDRFTIERLKARVIFTSNQVEVEEATGYLGGGKFTGSGGGILDGLSVQTFRFSLDGNNVTVPLPKDFMTTGDAQLEIIGVRDNPVQNLQLTISGRVYARRSIYSKDIDLANLVSGRRDPILSSGGSSLTVPRFDLVIEGRDALVVKNNIADLTASVSLVLTGDANEPRISGRITANSGTIFFRKERYEVQRGVLEFPPDTAVEPVINLQAESEIAGYQVYINLSGPLKDSEQLSATVRSSPALPQADVVSLITTGSLTNTAGGLPTFAQTGINTAAEILTDSIINNPARKATDRLFGLNVFEIDPIISGQNIANPSARLTVGRQINKNLRVTYATNLSQDQNQILALEYRVSNKLSLVAQYEQRALSNVTRTRDNFSFEIRFRRRF
ncbi:MAG: translocation/assembly module TamB domain-containing protein [Chloracidobacterium sp.]|nr:translocation/assembly module TamB domain-containing protein [Chloracidobacterium sp.]